METNLKDRRKKIIAKIRYIITLSILLVVLYFAYKYYQENNFNDFVRSETNVYTSSFKRDSEVKYSDKRSYKIESNMANDAMFYKNIKVEKNQSYKISCMVKTNNVVAENKNSGIGAQISVEGTTERSIAISGTQDWQKIEMIINSKDRENINIGFRLGGYLGKATGEVWFSDFKIEEGVLEKDNNWNFACFIFQNTDVEIEEKKVNINVTQNEINDIALTLNRFEKTANELSGGKINIKSDIHKIDIPLSKLSYSNQFGYYIAPEDVEEQIGDIINTNNYDHIFVIVKLGNEKYIDDIEINDWIGLGSMDYYGIGFSNIRLPNDSKNYIYKYNTRINQFPEEVFLHEFLHSLERTANEYGYSRPELHDYQKYGYKEEALIGQKKWYEAYMKKTIQDEGKYIGLPEEVYTLKPAKKSDFKNSYEMKEAFKQPENIIEELKELIDNLVKKIKYLVE